MGRLIDADELKEYMENGSLRLFLEGDFERAQAVCDMLNAFYKDVDNQPTVKIDEQWAAKNLTQKFKRGWIPCSKKLPEAGKEVLVCIKISNKKEVAIDHYDEEKHDWSWYNADYCLQDECEVVAWTELPPVFEKSSGDMSR